jgi:hypothetical protein
MHRPSPRRKHRKIDVEESPAEEESLVAQELSDDADSVRDDQRSSAPPAEIKSRTRPRGSRTVTQRTARNGARPASHTESVNG